MLKNFLFVGLAGGWEVGQKSKVYPKDYEKQDGSSELHIVDDKDGTPTYTIDFANNCNHLLSTNYFEYNMVCGDKQAELIAKELVKILGLESSITIKEVNSEFFSQEYFAERINERLINSKLDLRELNLVRVGEFA